MITQGEEAAPASARSAGEAITELHRRHYQALVRLAVLMTGNLQVAEDVVQDAYAALFRSWHKLRNTDIAAAFLWAVVMNNSRSVLRRGAVATRNTPPYSPGAGYQALVLSGRSALVAALGGLSPRQRQMVVLRYYAGLGEAEIAEVLGIRQGSVKRRAARGMAALQAVLTAPDGAPQGQGPRPDDGGFAGMPENAMEDTQDVISVP